jgi:hypothetical protein
MWQGVDEYFQTVFVLPLNCPSEEIHRVRMNFQLMRSDGLPQSSADACSTLKFTALRGKLRFSAYFNFTPGFSDAACSIQVRDVVCISFAVPAGGCSE